MINKSDKEKRSGKLKGRTCAYGRPKRCYTPKEDAYLTEIYLEALFTSIIIDTHKVRYVGIFDIAGTYLNADTPEEKIILLNIESEFVYIMCKVNPVHMENMRMENGVKALNLLLLKALYGCMESAILWYKLYEKTLKPQGFVVNQYDQVHIT